MSLVPPNDSSATAAPGNPVTAVPPGAGPAVGVAPTASLRHTGTYLLGAVAIAALVSSGLLWQKLNTIQEQLARQSADAGAQAIEARAMARQAQELVRDTAARLSVTEARVGEVALQRSQLEELMQSLSRSRDENLVVDIESAIRMAQQQAQLTGAWSPWSPPSKARTSALSAPPSPA